MKVKMYPSWIADDLIDRGHDVDDDIKPKEAFDEWCEWNGLIGYGPQLRKLYEETVGKK